MGGIAERLYDVRSRIAEALSRSGREPDSVRLVAVSKTKPVEALREAIRAGVTDLGENYVQELAAKQSQIGNEVQWHFIGHLQSNKARLLAPFCTLIHGVDSARLAAEISRRAAAHGRVQPVLIEVNLGQEAGKFGVDPSAVLDLAEGVLQLPHVCLRGLMTMPPFPVHPEDSRPYFIRLRELRDELAQRGVPAESLQELSMGMTADYQIAIEEGATLVRIGTAIFGSRDAAVA
jgi:pyridoxal phosphate enzyme (YggS family)